MEDNIIYIANKQQFIYERFVLSKLSQTKEITLKTRGKYILNAINIASFLQHKNLVVIRNIKISGSNFEKDGETRFVPEIEINLIKK